MGIESYSFRHPAKRFLAALFDTAGALLFFPVRLQKPPRPEEVRKILAVRLDHLGDAVMTRSALFALRKRFPQASIDLLISNEWAALFENEKTFRKVIPLGDHWLSRGSERRFACSSPSAEALLPELKRESYDIGIDFRGDLRDILLLWRAGIRHRLGYGITGGGFLLTARKPYDRTAHQTRLNFRLLEPLGIAEDGADIPAPPFSYSSNMKENLFQKFPQLRNPAVLRIAVHAGAGNTAKIWPQERFRELLKKITREKIGSVVLVGTETGLDILPEQKEDILDLRGKTSLAELPAVMDACRVFIGNDSGPAHVAAAQGLHTIVLFSSTNDPRAWKPSGRSVEIIEQKPQGISTGEVWNALIQAAERLSPEPAP